jgi:hypothetical protein
LRHLRKCLSTINTIANKKVSLKYMKLLSMWLSQNCNRVISRHTNLGLVQVKLSFFLSFLPSFFLSYSDHFLSTRCKSMHLITLNDTHTQTHSVGLLWERDQPDAEYSILKHTTYKTNSHITKGFEPAVPTRQRPQPYILDLANTVIGVRLSLSSKSIQ